MFVIYYQKGNSPKRYFHPEKGLQKTIKTAWALPESVRGMFEEKGLKTMTIPASIVAEAMYPSGVQKNKMAW